MSTLTITKTLTTAGNSYSLNGSYTITINLTNITENLDRALKDYDNPVMGASQANKPPKKTAIDLKSIKEFYEYQGHLMVSDGTYSSYEQKNILKAMAQQGGTVTIVLQTDSSTSVSQTNEPLLYNSGSGKAVYITKCDFTDVRTEGSLKTDTDATQVIGHDVIIGVLIAVPMGS